VHFSAVAPSRGTGKRRGYWGTGKRGAGAAAVVVRECVEKEVGGKGRGRWAVVCAATARAELSGMNIPQTGLQTRRRLVGGQTVVTATLLFPRDAQALLQVRVDAHPQLSYELVNKAC
jgi:hypothetical protein